jgi:hypothetical protein
VLEYNTMVESIMKLPTASSSAVTAMIPSLIQVRDAISSGQQAAHDMGVTLKTDLIDQLQIASTKLDAFTNSGIKDAVALKQLTKDFDDAYKAVQNYGNEVKTSTGLMQLGQTAAKDFSGDVAAGFIAAASGQEAFTVAMERSMGKAISSLGQWCQVKAMECLAAAFAGDPSMYVAAGEYEAAAVACGIAGAVISGSAGGSGSSGPGSMGSQQHQGFQTSGSTSQGTVTSTNVQRFADGALVSKQTLAMIGDAPSGGSAREGVLPLDNPEAMRAIAGAIAEHLGGMSGGGNMHFHTNVRGGVIDAGTLKSVMRQMSKRIKQGTGALTSSNTHRITRRSN